MVKLGLVYCCFLSMSLECHQNVRIAENEGSICEPGRLRCRQTMTLATAAPLVWSPKPPKPHISSVMILAHHLCISHNLLIHLLLLVTYMLPVQLVHTHTYIYIYLFMEMKCL